jgi:hypothetical protein
MAHRILLTRRDLDGHGAYYQHARADDAGGIFRIHRGTYLEVDTEVGQSITPTQRLAARAIAVGQPYFARSRQRVAGRRNLCRNERGPATRA